MAFNEDLNTLKTRYEKILLIIGDHKKGKTSKLSDLAKSRQCSVINLNLMLSERLLNLTKQDWQLTIKSIVQDILDQVSSEIVFIDNTEILFDAQLCLNPLKLFKDLSRNQQMVVTWNGRLEDGQLIYARPGHPEYRVETNIDFPVIDLNEQRAFE